MTSDVTPRTEYSTLTHNILALKYDEKISSFVGRFEYDFLNNSVELFLGGTI